VSWIGFLKSIFCGGLVRQVETLEAEVDTLRENINILSKNYVRCLSDKSEIIMNCSKDTQYLALRVLELTQILASAIALPELPLSGKYETIQPHKLPELYDYDMVMADLTYYAFPKDVWLSILQPIQAEVKKILGVWMIDINDCVADYEEIYTKEGVKKIKDLVEGDLVLSYDFDNGCYCHKPVTKIWNKGEQQLYRVHFRNGQHIDVTENHPLWSKNKPKLKEKKAVYEKKQLSKINLEDQYERKIPSIKHLPYEVRDISWLDEDLCFLIGHFLAEGWRCSSNVATSGHDCIEEVIPRLEKHGIP